MRIQSIYVDGFKNLSNVQINLESITALISLNNFGKSNVLTSIEYAINFIKAKQDEKIEMMSNLNYMPMNVNMFGKNYSFEVESDCDWMGKEYKVQYGFSFAWKVSEQEDPYIVEEHLKIRDIEKKKFVQLIDRTENKAVYKSCETGRCSSKILIRKNELIVNKLLAFDGLFYAEIIEDINSLRFYMENNLDAKSFFQIDPIIRKGLDDLIVNAENLPRVIYKLKKEKPEKFELLVRVYSQLFPNVENIIVKQYHFDGDKAGRKMPDGSPFLFANAVYVLYVKMDNLAHPLNFELMSDGAKRVFLIMTKLLLAKISNVSLVAIEEPENSVHPGLFKSYISIISQLVEDCKIIITSHSPYIVSYLSPAWIKVGVEKEKGIAKFFSFKPQGQKNLQNDAKELGMSIGDYLFSMLADPDTDLSEYLECDPNE